MVSGFRCSVFRKTHRHSEESHRRDIDWLVWKYYGLIIFKSRTAARHDASPYRGLIDFGQGEASG